MMANSKAGGLEDGPVIPNERRHKWLNKRFGSRRYDDAVGPKNSPNLLGDALRINEH